MTVTAAPTTAAPTTASPTTRPVEIGPFGIPVGAPVDADVGPEAAFAIHAHERTAPTDVVVAGSPADLYAAWLRATTPAGSEPVVATARGFRIVADEPVELQGFVVEDGRISSFEECTGDVCIPLADHVVAPPECQPGEGCPHVRSATGAITAEQRAILTQRWPQQVVVYELVVDAADGRSIAAVDEPTQQHFRYEPATQLFVATFPDRPAPGTRTQLSITFDDGTTDTLLIYYGA